MKQVLYSVICCSAILLFPGQSRAIELYESHQVPAYAKWGLLAMQKTKERYPQADIIDYLHIGREMTAQGDAIEKFKLWLRENGREYGVFVSIEFQEETEQILRITFQETDR